MQRYEIRKLQFEASNQFLFNISIRIFYHKSKDQILKRLRIKYSCVPNCKCKMFLKKHLILFKKSVIWYTKKRKDPYYRYTYRNCVFAINSNFNHMDVFYLTEFRIWNRSTTLGFKDKGIKKFRVCGKDSNPFTRWGNCSFGVLPRFAAFYCLYSLL